MALQSTAFRCNCRFDDSYWDYGFLLLFALIPNGEFHADIPSTELTFLCLFLRLKIVHNFLLYVFDSNWLIFGFECLRFHWISQLEMASFFAFLHLEMASFFALLHLEMASFFWLFSNSNWLIFLYISNLIWVIFLYFIDINQDRSRKKDLRIQSQFKMNIGNFRHFVFQPSLRRAQQLTSNTTNVIDWNNSQMLS